LQKCFFTKRSQEVLNYITCRRRPVEIEFHTARVLCLRLASCVRAIIVSRKLLAADMQRSRASGRQPFPYRLGKSCPLSGTWASEDDSRDHCTRCRLHF
jgi:hypothetical protein